MKNFPSLSRKFSKVLSGTWSLSEDQSHLHDLALKFAEKELSPKSYEWDTKGLFPVETFRHSASLGFGGIYLKPDYGGSGLSRLEASLIFECLSKGDVSFAVYLSVHNMVAWVLDTFASEYLKEKFLPSLISFNRFGAYCLTEPSSGSDAAAMKTTAKLQGGHYVINGSKMFITGGAAGDLMLVMCKTGPKSVSCLAVEKETTGVHISPNEEKHGWNSHPTNFITFENVHVPKEHLVGEEGQGLKIALKALEGGRVNISSCGLGGAWFALEKTRDYLEQREQFGKKLKDFQYLRFKMAESLSQLTTSRIVVRHAAEMIDQDNSDRSVLASISKLVATELCYEVANLAVQYHGGMGVIKSTGVERALRDLRILQIVEGTNEIMRMIIARGLFSNE
jgi:alkylation response protein AidB-like acyl-CoA dehydrogenase